MSDTPDASAARRNIKMIVAYNGAAYHGWQRQAEPIDTIQQRIEQAATAVMKHTVIVHGAGRTDAGVHATGQVANFRTTNLAVPMFGLRRAMNSRLPPDIAIRSAEVVADDFHASLSAVGKTYRYRICCSPVKPVELARQVYHYWRPLDTEAMRAAAMGLVGTHDFVGFATSGELRENTVRTVFRCEVAEAGGEITVSVQGDGFLYNMVRNIVGTLVEIGRGRWQPSRIARILETCDRRDAGPTAPPDGLTLVCVHY
jgi:tRNA pseudouridine38-40 synthase